MVEVGPDRFVGSNFGVEGVGSDRFVGSNFGVEGVGTDRFVGSNFGIEGVGSDRLVGSNFGIEGWRGRGIFRIVESGGAIRLVVRGVGLSGVAMRA